MSWFYLSFASDEGFLGGCYVVGDNLMDAVKRAWTVGCNPGGQARAAGPIPDEAMDAHVPAGSREVLLSYSELEALHDMAPWPATD
jgi:hypothetical protein